jgi:hypothetical protein
VFTGPNVLPVQAILVRTSLCLCLFHATSKIECRSLQPAPCDEGMQPRHIQQQGLLFSPPTFFPYKHAES